MQFHPRRRALPLLLVAALALLPPVAPLAQPIPQPSSQPAPPPISQPVDPPPSQVRLPSLGDAVSEDFGVGTERKLGEQIMREIRRDRDYLDDPLLLEYAQSVWQPLVKTARQRGEIGGDTDTLFAWELFLVRDRSVNAFALPGGYVGVHSGLLAMTATGDELASVLAHELSHVTQRHIARSIANASRQSMVGLAALIVGVLAASRSNNADVANAAIVGSQAAMIQGQLNFSRDMEREADRVGSGLLQGSGYSLAGMGSMFEKLEQANRLNDNGAYPYLRSHPLTTERIGEARARAQAAAGVGTPQPTLEHLLMQARARVLSDAAPTSLRRNQSQGEVANRVNDAGGTEAARQPAPQRLAALYEGALASLQLREPERARRALAAARALLPQAGGSAAETARAARVLQLLDAQLLVAGGEPAQALAALGGINDGSRPLLLARALAALDATRASSSAGRGALERSTDALQTWVTERPQDAAAWTLLAQGSELLGRKLRAVRAEAEARYAQGDLAGAADRLRAGQRLARGAGGADFIDASVIDARLRQVEAERLELERDSKRR